jgi:oligo-1,6-glucosidase
MHAAVFEGRVGDFVTVGEMPGVTVAQAQRFTDPSRRELDMVFQFEHVGLDQGAGGKFDSRPLDVRELKASFQRWQDGLATVGWNSLYWNNHDQPRAVSRFGNDSDYWSESARALAAVLHLQRGTPYIFQGEELGMTNVPFGGIGEIRDIESLNHFAEALKTPGATPESVLAGIRRAGRDNARTPMQWTSDAGGGFTTGTPWIGVHPNHERINAASQVGVDGSIFEFYRALIRLRHEHPVVSLGDFRMIAPQHPTAFAFERRLGPAVLLVLANFDVQLLELNGIIDVDPSGRELLLGNYPAVEASAPLRPWEVRILLSGDRMLMA